MTLTDIYSELSNHMLEGVMLHKQLSDYYIFLGLPGYSKTHHYHYLEESKAYSELTTFYISHFNRLLPETEIKNPSIIPSNWYRYDRCDVDSDTKQDSVIKGFDIWIDWENDTKKLYESFYNSLMQMGEVSSAIFIEKYITDVNNELECALSEKLYLKSVEWNMGYIVGEQENLYKKYSKMMK